MSRVTFNNKQSPFFQELKHKVDAYFKDNNLHPAGNSKLYFKSIIQIAITVSTYVVLLFFTPGTFISILLCMLFGICLAVLGFCVMHEGGHGSFSKHSSLNMVGAYFLNMLGGNTHFWKIKHNINHHTYTNIEGVDSDINVRPFMRLHDEQPRHWFHKFQHLYCLFLYGISYVVWIFWDDFEKYFTGKIAAGSEKPLELKEHIIFWITKILYVFFYIALPIMMVGFAKAAIGFWIATFVCGVTLSIVFQLAHVVEGTQFPKPDEKSNRIEQEWAIHQITTTSNFANDNKVISWLLGGLNFQIEHHLFPKVSHVHYPQIRVLIKETCEQFDLKYLEYPTMSKAVYAHFSHIKRLGAA